MLANWFDPLKSLELGLYYGVEFVCWDAMCSLNHFPV